MMAFRCEARNRTTRSDEGGDPVDAHGAGKLANLLLLVLAQAHQKRTSGPIQPLHLIGAKRDLRPFRADLARSELTNDFPQLDLYRYPVPLLVWCQVQAGFD